MNIHEKINARSWMPRFYVDGRFERMNVNLMYDPNHAIESGINIQPYCNSKECLSGNKKSEFKSKF